MEKISDDDGKNFTLITNIGTEVKCKAVVIAAGNGVFEPNRPPLSDILEYENKSVFYSVNKISDFQYKTIAQAYYSAFGKCERKDYYHITFWTPKSQKQ